MVVVGGCWEGWVGEEVEVAVLEILDPRVAVEVGVAVVLQGAEVGGEEGACVVVVVVVAVEEVEVSFK